MRVIFDAAARGSWNMAVDEWLLETVTPSSSITWRWYRWSEPTLSLGYFQSASERLNHPQLAQLPWLRRPSGGGAILHDREWTYSLIIPPEHRLGRDGPALYDLVHRQLRECLAERKFNAEQFAGTRVHQPADEPFLCFERRAAGDIVAAEHKIAGSAQRKRRGAVLQHGSILLAASAATPQLPGIDDLAGLNLDESFTRDFVARLAKQLGESVEPMTLWADDKAAVAEIERRVFNDPQWNEKR